MKDIIQYASNFQDHVGFRPPGRRVDIPLEFINPYKAHKIENIVNYFNAN